MRVFYNQFGMFIHLVRPLWHKIAKIKGIWSRLIQSSDVRRFWKFSIFEGLGFLNAQKARSWIFNSIC